MRGCETEKAHAPRLKSGFYDRFMQGRGIDVGYAGYVDNPEPVVANAIGVDLNYPGYDGVTLPFANESQDFVFAAHVLEHIGDYGQAIREWYRVTKVGGFLIICVPHRDLYEKQRFMPSRFCADHKRIYTPASFLREIEETLLPNSYRIESLRDCDDGYDYTRGPEVPIRFWEERIEVECVLRKIPIPAWQIL